MCTVSYIPGKTEGSFTLTSNRDEKLFRATLAPQVYNIENRKLAFPKDEKAGGSWIAANNNGRLCCLLNGAFVAHEKKPHYAQSRGNALIEATATGKSPEQFFAEKELLNVEPFTIVSVEKTGEEISHFSEFVWDGAKKYFRLLNADEPQIWSSVTLYSKEHCNLRKEWFRRFLQEKNGSISAEKVLEFHKGNHTADTSVNVIMEREGGLKTVSITQVVSENEHFRMNYFDLHNQQNSTLLI